ncbi:MAG: NADH-quinone oxidoreductase subunit NuoE [Synergistales bacterium]|nr:NADH-quinone oxidoreductase subunit NuoE [Synergistales bacterium]
MTPLTTESLEHLEARLEPLIDKYKGKKGITIPLLADVQKELGYIAEEAVDFLSKELDLPAAELFGVATFYAMFRLQPEGKYVIRVCRGTACHVQGSALIGEQIQRHFKVKDGETTEDGLFTLQYVACLGCCSLAPVMMVGNEVHGRLTPDKAIQVLESYRTRA